MYDKRLGVVAGELLDDGKWINALSTQRTTYPNEPKKPLIEATTGSTRSSIRSLSWL